MATLPAVSFDRYYDYEALTAHLAAVAAAAPERVRLHKICTTAEGRAEWLVEVSDFAQGEATCKPGYLVQANVHAVEVSGTTATLVLLQRLLSADCAALLREVVFYLIPRVNPDGAEYALRTGGQIRSKFERRPRKNGLVPQDVNGDGLILSMRWPDPFGAYRCDEEKPELMIRRKPGDKGPFYHVAQEGIIEDYDGGPIQLALRGFDFNRNWGVHWEPEHLQWGAGDHAFSHPEMKAIADWVRDHPNIFAMLGFHNGCNAVLRPSATRPDEEINAADLRVMKEIGALGERLTGFGLRAVRDYRSDKEPPIALRGHFTDWGYFGLGLSVFEIELGNLYNAAGISTEEYFAADEYTREVVFGRKILQYAETLGGQGFVPWQPFSHPQLGAVEIGGLHSVFWATPPAPLMEEIGERCADFICAHARWHPALVIASLEAEALGGQIYRIRARIGNSGGLPTCVTEQGARIAANGPVRVRLEHGSDVELLSRTKLFEIGSLPALTGYADLEWFVRAPQGGSATVRAEAPKAGTAEKVVTLPG